MKRRMDFNTLYNKYIMAHPNFLDGLNQVVREEFDQKLREETQEINFLSTISELKFAEFFQLEDLQYKYEPKIENDKTPDFKIAGKNNIDVFCDIKRFNVPEKNRRNDKLLNQLCTKLKSISRSYYVDIQQLKNTLNINVDLAFNEIKNWLDVSPVKLYDSYRHKDEIEATIVSTNGKFDYVIYMYSPSEPKIHALKIKYDIIRKIKSYQASVIEKNFPFVVGIDLSFDTLLDPMDYWLFFLGGSCEDIDTSSESFLLGEFYKDSLLDGLTGILIRYNGKFYWLKNPRNKFDVDFKNVEREYKLVEMG